MIGLMPIYIDCHLRDIGAKPSRARCVVREIIKRIYNSSGGIMQHKRQNSQEILNFVIATVIINSAGRGFIPRESFKWFL